jgi:hypothetical protein
VHEVLEHAAEHALLLADDALHLFVALRLSLWLILGHAATCVRAFRRPG